MKCMFNCVVSLSTTARWCRKGHLCRQWCQGHNCHYGTVRLATCRWWQGSLSPHVLSAWRSSHPVRRNILRYELYPHRFSSPHKWQSRGYVIRVPKPSVYPCLQVIGIICPYDWCSCLTIEVSQYLLHLWWCYKLVHVKDVFKCGEGLPNFNLFVLDKRKA